MPGSRGSLPGSQSARSMVINRRRARDGARPAVLPSIGALSGPVEAPKPPRGLRAPGKAAWELVWGDSGASWLADIDRPLVERFVQVVDEMARYRAALAKHGAVVEEPIVSPTGLVVGTRLAANPAGKLLKDAGNELQGLAAALGLSPQSRARLGLTAARARRTAAAALREESQ